MIKKVLLASLFIIVMAVSFILFQQSSSLSEEELEEIPMSLTVGSKLGFDVGNSSLTFGSAPPGSIVSRNVSVKNEATHSSRFRVSSVGSLADWVNVTETEYTLKGGEDRIMGISVNVPKNARLGDYNGTLRILITPA
jgi:uncharacterized membrane protein